MCVSAAPGLHTERSLEALLVLNRVVVFLESQPEPDISARIAVRLAALHAVLIESIIGADGKYAFT